MSEARTPSNCFLLEHQLKQLAWRRAPGYRNDTTHACASEHQDAVTRRGLRRTWGSLLVTCPPPTPHPPPGTTCPVYFFLLLNLSMLAAPLIGLEL